MTDITLHDLAEDVLAANPNGSKTEWGEALIQRVGDQGDAIAAEAEAKYVAAMGVYVSNVKAAQARADQAERTAQVTYHGRPLTPTVSVKGEYGRQLMLWLDASPRQFVEAVFREQSVVLGRLNSNKLRLKIAEMCQQDDALMEMPTLAAVCQELNVDPAELELEELA
jgi:hypothetical protein